MMEKLIKHAKYIGIGFFSLDLLYLIFTAVYIPLLVKGTMSVGIWFIVISAVMLVLNLAFAVLSIKLKNRSNL